MGIQKLLKMPFKKKFMARFFFNKKGNFIKLETTYDGVHKVKRKKNTHTHLNYKYELWKNQSYRISHSKQSN